jgi:hypothetical protein
MSSPGCAIALLAAVACAGPGSGSALAPVTAGRAQDSADAQAAAYMEALARDPVADGEAVRWFEALPAETQRTYAARYGVVLLEAERGDDFAFALGARTSPYPWVFIVSTRTLSLSGRNVFALAVRDDTQEEGAYWVAGQVYDRLAQERGPLFAEADRRRGLAALDLWIPASGWRYVGPPLERGAPVRVRRTDPRP